MPKINYTQIREICEDLYIRNNVTAKELCEKFEVSEQTFSKWKKGRDGEKSWEERKRMLLFTPVKLKELLMEEAQNIAAGNAPKFSSDAMAKIMKSIEQVDKRINPRIVFDVLRELDNFISQSDGVFATKCTEYHKQFLLYKISLEDK